MRTFIIKSGDETTYKPLGKYLRELKPGGNYIIEVKKNRAIRSLSANRYYHAILNIIGISTGHTHEELHEAMKMKFNCTVIFFPKGGSQVISKTTADLDTAEFAGYVNRVKAWALNEFGIIIPEAKDIDYARWLEIENTYEENQQG
jgi:hypothetical protein